MGLPREKLLESEKLLGGRNAFEHARPPALSARRYRVDLRAIWPSYSGKSDGAGWVKEVLKESGRGRSQVERRAIIAHWHDVGRLIYLFISRGRLTDI